MVAARTLLYWITHPNKVNRNFMLRDLRFQVTRAKSAYRRARYGYSVDDMIIYGYDGTMMTWTGRSIIEMTRYQHGYPSRCPSLEAWNQDCCFYGMCLVVGGDCDWSDEDIAWAKAAFPDLWSQARNKLSQRSKFAFDDRTIMFHAAYEIGRIGLVWLSKNYICLWD